MYNIVLILISFIFLLYILFKIELFLFLGVLSQILSIIFFSYNSGHLFITNLVEILFILLGILSLRLIFFNTHLSKEFKYFLIVIIFFCNIFLFYIIGNVGLNNVVLDDFYSVWFLLYVISYLIVFSSLIINMINVFQILISKDILLEKAMDSELKISFFFINVAIIMRMIWEYSISGEYWLWSREEISLLSLLMIMSCYLFLQKGVWQILFKIILVILSFGISILAYLTLI